MSKRRPREDESALWRAATQGVRPLKKKGFERPRPPASEPAVPAKPKSASKSTAASRPNPPPVSPPPAPARPHPEIEHGKATGLDRRSAERLRRGRLPIDGRLDLHGMTQAAAAERLAEFIAGAHGAGKRCVLVITGKGLAGGGVLREQVPRWLNQPPNRGRVLAFDYAQAQHGGMGALYVLLKRRRAP
jgi:DNA-nicking Smr family endonuclease